MSTNEAERILLVVDLSQEMGRLAWPGNSLTQMQHVKSALLRFIHLKCRTGVQPHVFGLGCLTEEFTMLQEFTTQADFVRDTLMQLEPQAEYGRCDVTNLLRVLYVMHIRNPGYISMHLILTHPFTSLGEMSSSSSPATSTGSSRPSVTRAIVVYGRSTVLPQFNSPYIEEQLRNELALCSNIFLDFIYLYDREADEQEVTTIFNFWYGFDDRDRFHGYNLARCGRELPEAVAALVAHPLQRPQMKDVRHNIEEVGKTADDAL